MWVLDNGSEESNCPLKLIIFNLNLIDFVQVGNAAKEKQPNCKNTGEIVREYEFPEEVASRKGGCHLNDIVLDSEAQFAYITDSGSADPGIIVYNFKNGTSWKVREPSSMTDGNGTINGIALSPPSKNRTVYYSTLTSPNLYSLPAHVLQNETNTNVSSALRTVGIKSNVSDGMMMDNTGTLYFGLEGNHSLAKWNGKSGNLGKNETIMASNRNFTWIDAFAFDLTGKFGVFFSFFLIY